MIDLPQNTLRQMSEQSAMLLLPNDETGEKLIIISVWQGGEKENSTDFYTCFWRCVKDNKELYEYLDNNL